jgi:predicted DNA-binding transcriptional regulator AlpA
MSSAQFLTVRETANAVGVLESTIRFWDYNAAGPVDFPSPVRIGRRVLYERAAIEAWVRQQIAKAKAEADARREAKVGAGSP